MIFSLSSPDEVRQYLLASQNYLAVRGQRRSMIYPFPKIGAKCLVCREICGARWKGYYARQMIHDEHVGPVAIHVGRCFKMKRDFSYFPDFLVPGRRLSRPSYLRFVKTFNRTRIMRTSIDELIGHAPEDSELTVALSTAYDHLYQAIRALRLSAVPLAIPAPLELSVVVFYELGPSVTADLFEPQIRWNPAHQHFIRPP